MAYQIATNTLARHRALAKQALHIGLHIGRPKFLDPKLLVQQHAAAVAAGCVPTAVLEAADFKTRDSYFNTTEHVWRADQHRD